MLAIHPGTCTLENERLSAVAVCCKQGNQRRLILFMPRPTRHFLLSLAAVLCGPLLGYAPTARAGFVADSIAAQPLAALATLPGFGPGSDLEDNAGTGTLGSSSRADDLAYDRLPSPTPADNGGRLPAQGLLPVPSGSGAGSAGGTTAGGLSGGSGGSMTATLPPVSSVPSEGPGAFLALQEAASLPPAFPCRLFRPPRPI